MQFRSFFNSLFQKLKEKTGLSRAKMLDGYGNAYAPFDGNIYNNAAVRDCVDTIARHVSKLKARHIVRKEGNIVNIPDDPLNYLLGTRPNWMMTASDFLQKIVAQYYTTNNLIVYIQRDDNGKVIALWPVNFTSLEMFEDRENNLYGRFTFGSGERATVPYEDLIHIRRNYNRLDLFGETDNKTLSEDIDLFTAVKVAIINAVKNSNKLRGIINWQGTLRKEDQEERWKEFVQSFAGPSNGSGIGALDNRATFQQLTSDVETFDSSQMTFARDNIYKHFGLNEKIIKGMYSEEEYQAFYEGVIEPLAIDLAQEFTHKIFTSRERSFGNEVTFESNRLSYMTVASKCKLASAMIPAGAIKRNEIRELFGYSGLPGKEGEEIVVSLNYVKSTDQSKYQIGDDGQPAADDGEDNNDMKGGDNDEE